MRLIVFALSGLLIFSSSCKRSSQKQTIKSEDTLVKIEVIGLIDTVISRWTAGAEAIKYGIEGGRVVKVNNQYHLITSEMADDPRWVKMRTGYWTSPDGIKWTRKATIRESDGNFTGSSQKAAVWGPQNVFNPKDNRWHLFYVYYKSMPDTFNIFRLNFDGIIQHAVSQTPGEEGVGGPYEDASTILRYDDPDKGSWEGLQGTDSFFPYNVDGKWYGLYGSASTQDLKNCQWRIGLAEAEKLEGPWKRMNEVNPLKLSGFAENPIVYKLDNGIYMAIADGGHFVGKMGYFVTRDGINWSDNYYISLEPQFEKWWSLMRTPLSLIKEDDGSYTMFFTAYKTYHDGLSYGCLSKLSLRLTYVN